jgi:hypothetical protein
MTVCRHVERATHPCNRHSSCWHMHQSVSVLTTVTAAMQEFINQPIATELLHNGELLQVLGLTNYSHWEKAPQLRSCLLKDNAIAGMLALTNCRCQAWRHAMKRGNCGSLERERLSGPCLPREGAAGGLFFSCRRPCRIGETTPPTPITSHRCTPLLTKPMPACVLLCRGAAAFCAEAHREV